MPVLCGTRILSLRRTRETSIITKAAYYFGKGGLGMEGSMIDSGILILRITVSIVMVAHGLPKIF